MHQQPKLVEDPTVAEPIPQLLKSRAYLRQTDAVLDQFLQPFGVGNLAKVEER